MNKYIRQTGHSTIARRTRQAVGKLKRENTKTIQAQFSIYRRYFVKGKTRDEKEKETDPIRISGHFAKWPFHVFIKNSRKIPHLRRANIVARAPIIPTSLAPFDSD